MYRLNLCIASTQALPDPVYTEQNSPAFYAEVNGEERLRPAWQLDWEDNVTGWGQEFAQSTAADGAKYQRGPLNTEEVTEVMRALQFDEIVGAVHRYFKSCQTRWKDSGAKKKDGGRRKMLYSRQKSVSVDVLLLQPTL